MIYDDPASFDLVGPPDTALDRAIPVTVFADRSSFTALKVRWSLVELARQLGNHKAATKDELPYVKLARFGKQRTKYKALRHNANLEAVTGIEGDYDAGTLDPSTGAEMLAAAGIAALIYTTASHGQPGKGHRWRVLAPCATEHLPEARAALVARLNGALGGVLADESFTAVQSFTFGHALDRDPPRTWLVEGRCIDEAPELDARAIGKPTRGNTPVGDPVAAVDQSGDPEAIAWAASRLEDAFDRVADAVPGERNATLNRNAYTMGGLVACTLLDAAEVEAALLEAAETCGYVTDYSEAEALRVIRAGLEAGIKRPSPYSPVGADDFDDLDDPAEAPEADGAGGGLQFLSPGDCAAMPPRDYIVKGLIGPSQVGCIFGDPGAGKSVVAPRLAYAVAQGSEIFGLRTRPGGVFYVACEDESGMAARVTALHHGLGEAPGFKLVTGASDLFTPGQAKEKGSPHLEALRRAVKAEAPKLIVIDTLAMAMPGLEENDATGMARVVKVGRALARWGAAVIFIHHGTKAEGSTPRGHSVFNGALDFSIQVKPADQTGIVRGAIRKNRNGPPDLDIAFRIASREVGLDVDGEPVTAPFCEPCAALEAETTVRLTGAERAALALMKEMAAGADRVPEAEWREAAIAGRAVSGSEERANRRKAVTRALAELTRLKLVRVEEGSIITEGSAGALAVDFDDDQEEWADAAE